MRNIIHIILRLCLRHTFDEWLDIYTGAPPGSKPRKNALKGMVRTAITHEQWEIVYGKAEAGSKTEETAFRWMEKLGK